MFGQDRTELRETFFTAWEKHLNKKILEPLESVIVNIIDKHPEYHELLKNKDKAIHQDYTPEMGQTNPFLHMAMHISIHEQLSTRRPDGIESVYQSLLIKFGDPHEVEHQMMECLGKMLWQAQSENRMPDDEDYIECLKRLI